MRALRKLFDAVALDRRWWWALLVINFVGSLYGFWWYRYQLQATELKYWLIVPDSPGSTFLLTIWLGLLLAGFDWRKPGMQILGAIAFVSNMKYGLWTATVLPQAGFRFGWEFDFVHLSLSHASMWVQGLLFSRYYKPALVPALIALSWMLFQDLIDYQVLMTHPTLPTPAGVSLAVYQQQFAFDKLVALLLSVIWGGYLVVQALRQRRASAK